jgi:hypothetical protein
MVSDDHGADGPLCQSECFELLSSKRRRVVLELMADSDRDDHSVESLATAIAQTEQQSDLAARPTRRVCLFLHHVHLPKLDDAGIVDYDAKRNSVEYTGRQRAQQLLETLRE